MIPPTQRTQGGGGQPQAGGEQPIFARMPSGEELQFAPGTDPRDIERTARSRMGLPTIDPGEQQAVVLQQFAVSMAETLAENREMTRQVGAGMQQMAQMVATATQAVQQMVAIHQDQAGSSDEAMMATQASLEMLAEQSAGTQASLASAAEAMVAQNSSLGEAIATMQAKVDAMNGPANNEVMERMDKIDAGMAKLSDAVTQALAAPREILRDTKGRISGIKLIGSGDDRS